MKSVIVIYYPDTVICPSKKSIKKDFKKKVRRTSQIILIKDPTIENVKVEVHFNPYKK